MPTISIGVDLQSGPAPVPWKLDTALETSSVKLLLMHARADERKLVFVARMQAAARHSLTLPAALCRPRYSEIVAFRPFAAATNREFPAVWNQARAGWRQVSSVRAVESAISRDDCT
eukprot:6204977-Pleurochrysis_carterae.AAC.4